MKKENDLHPRYAGQPKQPRRFPRESKVPKGQQWSSKKVFNEVHSYLNRQIHFTHGWQSVVVTLWAMGTYLHRQFPCYGHLWLNSPTTHSGKSKLLNVLWTICHKAHPPMLEPTAAVLFRFGKAIGGTMLIDEVDKLDEKKRSDVIAMLNEYHKYGVVLRNTPRKGKYTLESFPIYCPKVIAGIESLPVTLQDRCIRIALHRKTASEKVDRFMPEDYDEQLPLRNQLEAWAGRKSDSIMKSYRDREALGVPAGVEDDRVRDILEPLFAVASALPRSVQRSLSQAALEIAQGRKSEESESNPVVAAIHILMRKFPKDTDLWPLRTEMAYRLLGDIPGLETLPSVQELLRTKLGFGRSKSTKFDNKVLRAYHIPRRKLEKLSKQYS
jgi:Protein of unknown function (DUF3631)